MNTQKVGTFRIPGCRKSVQKKPVLIKCDKYSLGVGESNLEAEGVITLTASNATIFFIVGVVDQPSKGSDLPVTLRQ